VLLFLAGHRDATDGLTAFDISTLSNPLLHALRPVSAQPSQNDLGLLFPVFHIYPNFHFSDQSHSLAFFAALPCVTRAQAMTSPGALDPD
jgi:hypothetical protein